MTEPFGIALIGCGTVGTGVARLLLEQTDRLRSRAGRPLVLRKVVVRDPEKPRGLILPDGILTANAEAAVHDPTVQVVVELIGGIDRPRELVLAALAAGKHVVTANKALLAHHGAEVFAAARDAERTVAFEASVAGGVPIIAAIAQSLTANQIVGLQGILNGTSNFILTAMSETGATYADALKEAQARGYAEADPTLDVDGSDAAHKLAILTRLAFGAAVPVGDIPRRGIAGLDAMDIRFARELGYTVKLLAEAWLLENRGHGTGVRGEEEDRPTASETTLALHVSPVLLRNDEPLARVRGAYNAVQVFGDVVGDTLYQGRGAGQMATASAVVADLIDLAVGRAQRTFQTACLWSNPGPAQLRQTDTVRSRFYLRLLVADQPGVLADTARVLANHGISISSVIQHEALPTEPGETAVVPLVIMTHAAPTGQFQAAFGTISRLPAVRQSGVHYPVAD